MAIFSKSFSLESLAKWVCASTVVGTVVYYVGNSLTSSTLVNSMLGTVIGVIVYFSGPFLV